MCESEPSARVFGGQKLDFWRIDRPGLEIFLPFAAGNSIPPSNNSDRTALKLKTKWNTCEVVAGLAVGNLYVDGGGVRWRSGLFGGRPGGDWYRRM